MTSDLARHIQQTRAIDTHEHMMRETVWLEDGPRDVLEDLFANYVPADLVSAGATPEACERLADGSDQDIEGRWAGIERAWHAIQFTGYGQAVRLLAAHVYRIDEITPDALRAAQPKLEALRQPGQRLHLLRDRANLDHIQTDDFRWPCEPDESGPDFFLYDLSWKAFTYPDSDFAPLADETGVEVKDLGTLRRAMESLFTKHGPTAIAVKSQHAYSRTLRWVDRSDADAERALQAMLKDPDRVDEQTCLCLGDWCWARGTELAIEHGLPFKIHTGYYAGNRRMVVDRIRAGHLCPLLVRYPEARFVLMHIAYPYDDELIALVKHFRNTYADLCWAWSINPVSSMQFLRRFLHAAPASKLFAFGGDTGWPTSAYAYALQMRHYLTRALEAEVADGEMTEAEAIEVATRLLRANQAGCFDIEGTRAAAIRMTAQT